MIIDATKHFHPDYRPYTNTSAVAAVLAPMDVGAVLMVRAMLDATGKPMDLCRLQTLVHKCKGASVFQTRQAIPPMLAAIRRIA